MRHELIHAFLYISIHAPTRGATKWIPCCGQSAHISIHAPARGATNSASMMSALSLFQSTLPQGERLVPLQFHILCAHNFNPRSHKGSDPESHHFRKLDGISIHAPTRGATILGKIFCVTIQISIHAPTRGATAHPFTSPYLFWYFNPRSHKGSDGGTQGKIRIHQNFNPRSHKGSDFFLFCSSSLHKISIHAPTRGATYLCT